MQTGFAFSKKQCTKRDSSSSLSSERTSAYVCFESALTQYNRIQLHSVNAAASSSNSSLFLCFYISIEVLREEYIIKLFVCVVAGGEDGTGGGRAGTSFLLPQRRPPLAAPARPHGHPPLPVGHQERRHGWVDFSIESHPHFALNAWKSLFVSKKHFATFQIYVWCSIIVKFCLPINFC